jgi:hypothetical protein
MDTVSKDRTRPRWPLAPLLCALLIAGCQNCDLVESELRARENDVAHLHGEVQRLHAQNVALERELVAVRHDTAAKITPELASQTYSLQRIVLARQTGGYDNDGVPGDEALQVVIQPLDPDGQSIKAPGSVNVQALEITTEGLKRPLAVWHVNPDQLRRSWRSGLFSTGYFLLFPWKHWPTNPHLRVVVHFTLADGRAFEADKDVTIRLPPDGPSGTPPPPGPPGPPPPDSVPPDGPVGPPLDPDTPLPPPRKVDAPAGPAVPTAAWLEAPAPPLSTAVQMLKPVPAQ